LCQRSLRQQPISEIAKEFGLNIHFQDRSARLNPIILNLARRSSLFAEEPEVKTKLRPPSLLDRPDAFFRLQTLRAVRFGYLTNISQD